MRSLRKPLPCGGGVETPFGFDLTGNLAFEDWQGLLARAARDRSKALWRLADLLVYGESRYAEAYARAVEATGLAYQTIANLKSTARRVELYRRRENLSFGHHAEVAALSPEAQDRLLSAAVAKSWSRERLRAEAAKVPPEARRTIRVQVTHEQIQFPVPASFDSETISYLIPTAPSVPFSHAPAPEPTEPATAAASSVPERYREEIHGTPISLNSIGRDSEAPALRAALRELATWAGAHGACFDANTAGLVRQLRAAIERQIGVAIGGQREAVDSAPNRRQLH